MDDGKANALSDAMIAALLGAIEQAEKEASALVLLGRPERFSGGFDLKTMMSGPAQARELLRKGADLFLRFYGCPLPLIVGCTGHALAGGALLVLTGDVRIGAAGPYRIGLNEVQIGLPVPVLGIELARDRLRKSELVHATVGAKIYGPEEAKDAGYLDEVVTPDSVRARALEEATRLTALGRHAYSATKLRLRRSTMDDIRTSFDDDMKTLLPG
jgi:enoyl-CoA hydratase